MACDTKLSALRIIFTCENTSFLLWLIRRDAGWFLRTNRRYRTQKHHCSCGYSHHVITSHASKLVAVVVRAPCPHAVDPTPISSAAASAAAAAATKKEADATAAAAPVPVMAAAVAPTSMMAAAATAAAVPVASASVAASAAVPMASTAVAAMADELYHR